MLFGGGLGARVATLEHKAAVLFIKLSTGVLQGALVEKAEELRAGRATAEELRASGPMREALGGDAAQVGEGVGGWIGGR